jgi:hypothetical protein
MPIMNSQPNLLDLRVVKIVCFRQDQFLAARLSALAIILSGVSKIVPDFRSIVGRDL